MIKEKEPAEPVQMNVYQSTTYKKDLSWLHFDDEPRVQERQWVKDQQFYKSVFVAYPTIPHMTTVFHAWPYGLRRGKFHRTNQGSIFLGERLTNRDNIRAPIQSRRESQSSILKNEFSSRTDPFILAPVLLDWSNETSWDFLTLKSTSHFLPQSTVSRRSDSRSEASSGCFHRSE